jgi:hypothetical protein
MIKPRAALLTLPVLALALLAATPALANKAGDAACMWANTPPDERAALAAGFEARGADGLSRMQEPSFATVIVGAANACGVSIEDNRGGKAYAAYALRLLSAQVLGSRYGVGAEALNGALAAAPAADRARLAAILVSGGGGKPFSDDDATFLRATVSATAVRLKLPDDAIPYLGLWMMGVLLLEAYEPQA